MKLNFDLHTFSKWEPRRLNVIMRHLVLLILLVSPCASLFAQSGSGSTITVTGTVKDNNGFPIAGAAVTVPGTTIGVATNANGEYRLNGVSTSAKVEASSIGYTTVELAAQGTLNFILEDEYNTMDEVVVVGYATQKKVNLSGAVATVSTKQLENRPVLNVGQALQGTVANLKVTTNGGAANSTPSFNIRGKTTISGEKVTDEAAPLVVIDGVIADAGQLNRMNINDIANVSVLKDASSAAIYGSRAAYGVILVTTKTGTSEKLTVNYNNNFTLKKITVKPSIIRDPYDVATTRNTMATPWYTLYNDEQLAYAKKRSEDPRNTSPYYLNPDGTYTYFGNTDWVNEAYKSNSFSTSHAVDVSGRTDKVSYYFSSGYNYDGSMLKYGDEKYNRYNVRSKLDFKLTDYWTLSNNTRLTTSMYKAPAHLDSGYYWGINRINPLDVPRNEDGTWTSAGASYLGNFEDGGKWRQKQTNVNTQFDTKINILKDILVARGTFSYNYNSETQDWAYLPVAYYDGPNRQPRYTNTTTSAENKNVDSKHLVFDTNLTFQQTFGGKHWVSAMIGFNQEEYRNTNRSANRKKLISNLPSTELGYGDITIGEKINTWALRSGYGRLNYIYDDKYIFEFSGRYDGTSRFPKDDRFVFNPSGSVAWVVSKEKFFEPIQNVVSFLKFRVSYGQLGNQAVSDYGYIPTMAVKKTGYILDGKQQVYVEAPGLVSKSLTWEKVSTINYGMEVNFLNNRMMWGFDMYTRRTKDMLTAGQVLPAVLGTGVPKENAANLKTEGWELNFNWRDKAIVGGKTFNYNVGFNIGDSRTYITKFANPTGFIGDNFDGLYSGRRWGEQWGLTTLGLFQSMEEIQNSPDQSSVASYLGYRPIMPGDLKFQNRNNDNVITNGERTLDDPGDYHIIGNTEPRYQFGITAGADWNGIDFSVFFQGVGKRDYFPGPGNLYFWGIYAQPWTNITKGNFYDRWTEDNPNGYFPRFKSYVAEQQKYEAGIPQTRYKQNARYLRLKNLTLGYTLPKHLTSKMKIDRVRIFFSGDNLWVTSGLYKHFKVDPENLANEQYPLQRTISFGLNVTF